MPSTSTKRPKWIGLSHNRKESSSQLRYMRGKHSNDLRDNRCKLIQSVTGSNQLQSLMLVGLFVSTYTPLFCFLFSGCCWSPEGANFLRRHSTQQCTKGQVKYSSQLVNHVMNCWLLLLAMLYVLFCTVVRDACEMSNLTATLVNTN